METPILWTFMVIYGHLGGSNVNKCPARDIWRGSNVHECPPHGHGYSKHAKLPTAAPHPPFALLGHPILRMERGQEKLESLPMTKTITNHNISEQSISNHNNMRRRSSAPLGGRAATRE